MSASVVKPGATVNVGKRGTRGTVGLPGTGISYSEDLSTSGQANGRHGMGFGALLAWGLVALVVGLVVFG